MLYDFLFHRAPDFYYGLIHIIHFLLSISYNQSENRRLIGGTIIVQKLTYTQYGDYHNPDIRLAHTGTQALGKYGRMRKAFLEQNNPMCFNDMVLTETLFSHLWEVQQICEKRMKLLMEDLLAKNPAPDKATQQLEWVAHMNSLKAQAEEIILQELIYEEDAV